jgi:hypothetical protein
VRSNTRGGGLDGGAATQHRIRLHNDGTGAPPITLYRDQRTGAVDVDRVFVRAEAVRPGVWRNGSCVNVGSTIFERGSEVELVTTTYGFRTQRNPSARGW